MIKDNIVLAQARGAPQPASEACEFTVGSFNFGTEQAMLTGMGALKHFTHIARVCGQIVGIPEFSFDHERRSPRRCNIAG